MNSDKQYRIALVLYTQGLDYDDRIRKEILTIQNLFSNVSFHIFAVEANNREEEGVTSYGIPYRIPYLKSRDQFASGTHTLIKAWDFYQSIKKDLKRFDVIWCADVETFLFVLLTRKKPIVWDLHELPNRFLVNGMMKKLFNCLESRCSVMIHANEQRLQYLIDKGYIRHQERNFVLRNYPQFNEIDTDYDETYQHFDDWLGDSKCAYLQGINGQDRADIESLEAILSVEGLKGVVVGYTRPELLSLLEEKHSQEELRTRLYFTGRVKQLKTPQYIKRCIFGMVFYKNTCMNNWYCEANRFFQNIINGNPVIVGQNPSLKETVNDYHLGVVAETDGSNSKAIHEAIMELLSRYDYYKENVNENKDNWLWNQQEPIVREIVNKMLS